ncbi:hypothetical protein [Nocardioides sp.]|uniref:hypothetical protein n=1 Tax=Nocardioides sp. TaxID=35761 RepID=UPI002CD5C17C|nr:hypothetical protein [Nocardioides sp.]HSX66889.1 hypothetical protein [Nocardioides sp.]
MTSRASRPTVVGVCLVALATLAGGYWLGLRSPWFDHHPRAIEGTAEAVRSDVPLATFVPAGGGRHIAFRTDAVIWKSGDRTDANSVPPCLREPSTPADVTVEVLDLSRPFGSGGYAQVVTVICAG